MKSFATAGAVRPGQHSFFTGRVASHPGATGNGKTRKRVR